MPETARRRLLLVGAGHGHLHLIRHAARLRAAGYEVTLIAPRYFHYSGTASATAAGALPAEHGRIDVAALARRHGMTTHHVGLLAELDVRAHTADTDDGTELEWDVVSLNIGSVVDPGPIRVGDGVLTVKPLDTLAGLAAHLEPARMSLRPVAITVVGAGPSGVEVAAHAATRSDGSHAAARVVLVDAGPRLAPDLPAAARRRLLRHLRRARVELRLGAAVQDLDAEHAGLADGTRIAHDVAVLATGLSAPPLIERVGLGDRRGIPVRATLAHRDHHEVYAVGDCALFLPRPLPRVGVHGVRQGPILLEALLARAHGRPAPVYRPQATALAILDLGGGRGLAVRGRWWWEGRSALWLKRAIDRRWLRRYQG